MIKGGFYTIHCGRKTYQEGVYIDDIMSPYNYT